MQLHGTPVVTFQGHKRHAAFAYHQTNTTQYYHSLQQSLPESHQSGGECGVPFIERFTLPYDTSKPWWDDVGVKRNPEWYSFEQGPIHFLSFTTELDFSPGSPQYL